MLIFNIDNTLLQRGCQISHIHHARSVARANSGGLLDPSIVRAGGNDTQGRYQVRPWARKDALQGWTIELGRTSEVRDAGLFELTQALPTVRIGGSDGSGILHLGKSDCMGCELSVALPLRQLSAVHDLSPPGKEAQETRCVQEPEGDVETEEGEVRGKWNEFGGKTGHGLRLRQWVCDISIAIALQID